MFQGDVTPAVSNGIPFLGCAVEGSDFASAVTETVARLRAAGFAVEFVQAEPDAVAA